MKSCHSCVLSDKENYFGRKRGHNIYHELCGINVVVGTVLEPALQFQVGKSCIFLVFSPQISVSFSHFSHFFVTFLLILALWVGNSFTWKGPNYTTGLEITFQL